MHVSCLIDFYNFSGKFLEAMCENMPDKQWDIVHVSTTRQGKKNHDGANCDYDIAIDYVISHAIVGA